jgi:DNA-binding MarR family transcriptional regulator
LLHVHARLTRELDARLRERHDLTLNAFDVLHVLANAPERRLRQASIAGGTMFTHSAITQLTARLEAEGLVAREPDPEDGRGTWTALTPAGVRRFTAAKRTQVAFVEARLGPLEPAERRALVGALGRVAARLDG